MTRSHQPPDARQGSLAVVCLLMGIGLMVAWGCAASSPRFKSSESSTARESPRQAQPRFAARIREEELREDDRKVDVEDVRERYSAADASPPPADRSPRIDRKKVMTEVLGLIGTPYALGENDTAGMDCSAFTNRIYEDAIGRSIPRTTSEQYAAGMPVRDRLRFGDLVFFNTTGESPSHVGVFIGDDLFAHASVAFGVTISSLQSSYYKKRYIGARRFIE